MALAGQGRETWGGAGDGDAARHYGSICAAWSSFGRTEEKNFSSLVREHSLVALALGWGYIHLMLQMPR